MELWLAENGLDASVLLPLISEWGVTSVEELSFIEDFDVEDSELPLVVKRKLIAALAALTGTTPYSDRVPASEPAPATAEVDSSLPGGTVTQPERPPTQGLPIGGWKAKDSSLLNASAYCSQCQSDGIPSRPQGLFPPGDEQLIVVGR